MPIVDMNYKVYQKIKSKIVLTDEEYSDFKSGKLDLIGDWEDKLFYDNEIDYVPESIEIDGHIC